MKHNKKLTTLAQNLRKGMTKEEKQLWYQYLREYPIQFRRQVTCGQYILDFYCAKANFAVELDGSQHYEPEAEEKDMLRTQYLESLGIFVLRVPNNAIWNNFEGVCEQIDILVHERL
jgi:very-short-patch-repair endonuclease